MARSKTRTREVMTPKEKARELVDKYSKELEHIARIADEWSMSEFSDFRQLIAIKCASLAVDAILNQDKGAFDLGEIHYHFEYWNNVKEELEKL